MVGLLVVDVGAREFIFTCVMDPLGATTLILIGSPEMSCDTLTQLVGG